MSNSTLYKVCGTQHCLIKLNCRLWFVYLVYQSLCTLVLKLGFTTENKDKIEWTLNWLFSVAFSCLYDSFKVILL